LVRYLFHGIFDIGQGPRHQCEGVLLFQSQLPPRPFLPVALLSRPAEKLPAIAIDNLGLFVGKVLMELSQRSMNFQITRIQQSISAGSTAIIKKPPSRFKYPFGGFT